MKYIITEDQHNDLIGMLKLMSNNDDDNIPSWVRRRIPSIEENIEHYITQEDPMDYDDEFDYAGHIIDRVIEDFFDLNEEDEKYYELQDILKERYGERLIGEYILRVSNDEN
jgi:hypothetical protein